MHSQAEYPLTSHTTSEAGPFWAEAPDHGRAMDRMGATLECRLVGVDPTLASMDEKLDARRHVAMIETAVRLLGKERGLTLGFSNRIEEAGVAPQPSLRLGVVCDSGSCEEAQRGLNDILPLLEHQTGYRFNAEAIPAVAPGIYENAYELEGVMLTSRSPKGLSVASESALPILFSRPGRYHPLRSAWTILSRSRFPVSLELGLHLVELQAESLDYLEQALNLLLRGKVVLLEYPSRRLQVPGEADAHYEYVKGLLEAWLRYPRGYRVSARLSSDSILPAGLAHAVGGAIYPGRHFHLAEHAAPMPQALDLRACFNESHHLPELAPSLSDVMEMEIPAWAMPHTTLPSRGTRIGESGGQPVCLDWQARLRHVFVLGATGSGKSTLLLNMIRQDMLAGEGVCLVDPNGDLYEDVKLHIPPERADDVVLLDAGDFDRAYGLNFLEVDGPHPEIMASQNANAMLHILGRLYDLRVAGGPMFEMYMRAALLLVMRNRLPGLTLIEAARAFSDEAYRLHLIRHCIDAETVHFWRHVAQQVAGDHSLSNIAPYVISKLNQMTHNALVKPIIGQSKSTVSFREMMDQGKIVLVNLSKGRLGEMDARFLGMMLLSKLSAAALGRADMAREARKPFYVYVDEYHNYAGEANLSLMLAEGRKYGIGLTLATQHLQQLKDGQGAKEALAAVMGNAATHIYFRTGPVDEEILAPFLGAAIPRHQMAYLPDYAAAVRVMAEGHPLPPFVMNAAPVPTADWPAEASRVATGRIQEMYGKYTRTALNVEAEIAFRGKLPKLAQPEIVPSMS
ncbi:MAG: type IV secretion system DNA-binding domain-containing protein [Sulfuriferula multivorans]|uniref:Type IV secretion system DNA-binding domain-containing protein n=1 Tax=Sulfuriferula multivorans TaxID=1559896 RepID=A0A7C9NT46_9PROT|nr:type IV secretion system DNA-binding domain-containing protein [Sulfuriferula multivorans]